MRKLMALPILLLLAACAILPGSRVSVSVSQTLPSTPTPSMASIPTATPPPESIEVVSYLKPVEPAEKQRRAEYAYMVLTSTQANISAFETLAINIRDEKIDEQSAIIYKNFVGGVMKNSTDFLTMTPDDANLLPYWDQVREYNDLASSIYEDWLSGRMSDGQALSEISSLLANFDNTMKNVESVIGTEFGISVDYLSNSRTQALQSFRAAMSTNAVALASNGVPDLK